MYVSQQQRRDTAANWTTVNSVLLSGEVGIETDTNKAKLGDGITAWNALAYWNPSGGVTSAFGRTGVVTAQAGDYTAAQVGAVATTAVGAANGVASLDATTHIPVAQVPQLADYAPTGVGSATSPARFIGGTTGGAAPTGGPYNVGDFVISGSVILVCTVAGSPGTWSSYANSAGGAYALIFTSSLTGGSSTSGGQWQQFATITITSQFSDINTTFTIVGVGGGATSASYAQVRARVKQQNAMGSAPYIELYVEDYDVIQPANIIAITTVNSISQTVVQLWLQATQNYESYYVFKMPSASSGASFSGVSGSTWTATGSLPAGTQTIGSSTTRAQTQVFTSSGTWTMPLGATSVMVWAVSAGGGGGSGASLASGTASSGGGGGCSGLTGMAVFPASLLTSTVAVSVGSAGGTGGTSVTSGNGVGGALGGGSGFGSYLRVTGGPGGNAGGTSTASGGNGSSGTQGGASGGGGTLGAAGGAGNQTSNSGGWGSGGGGGGGGGISATPAAFNGGAGGSGVANTHGSGGVVGGALPTADTATTFYGAGGSGGGASAITGAAQAGANGVVYGAGGGGGGAAISGSASGAGGNGAQGIVIVTTFF